MFFRTPFNAAYLNIFPFNLKLLFIYHLSSSKDVQIYNIDNFLF